MFFRQSRLACSFCGRGAAEVEKLVAGPRVYICDRCAALAMQIMTSGSGEAPRPPRRSPALLTRVVRWLAGRLGPQRRGGFEYGAAAR